MTYGRLSFKLLNLDIFARAFDPRQFDTNREAAASNSVRVYFRACRSVLKLLLLCISLVIRRCGSAFQCTGSSIVVFASVLGCLCGEHADGVHEERARKISVKVVHRVGLLTAQALVRLQSVVADFVPCVFLIPC